MKNQLGLRDAAGWLALGAAGVVAIVIAAWLFFGDSGSDLSAPAGESAGDAVEQALGPLDSGNPDVGQPAPDFALLDARDATTVRKLSDYRGKTVVLNWFASWCGPCLSEMPDFEEAYQALGAESGEVVFLLVNLAEPQETASHLLNTTGATYPAVLDSDGTVADSYRVTGMPTTYFIDKDGVVFAFGRGRITAETLKSELERLGHTY